LARAWIESASWNDLANVPSLRPDPVNGWPDAALPGRQSLLDWLRHGQPSAWYSIRDFVGFVREYAMDFLRPDGDYDAWAMRGISDETPLRGIDAWDAVEGALVLHLLTGPLFWFGLVDLGRETPSSAVSSFRLSTAGTAILGINDAPDVPEPAPLRLGDDGLVLAPVRQRYARFQLRRIAQPAGWAEGYHYRLTPSSLALARQQRISVRRVIDFLQEVTGRVMPSHLRVAIESAYQGQDTARLERVWLLRVADPAMLKHQSIQGFIQEHLEPGVALIRAEDREKVLAVLARSGILPDISP
jgi:hypothetical protein